MAGVSTAGVMEETMLTRYNAAAEDKMYMLGTSLTAAASLNNNEDAFGKAEYRYHPSLITGRFRSTAASTLDSWHLAQKFATRPLLNSEFIIEKPPIARVSAVNTTLTNEFIFDSFFNTKMARPMPMYSVPGAIDHF